MRRPASLVAILLLLLVPWPAAPAPAPGPAERIADGVLLYRLDDPALLDPPGPIAVQALRLDPRKTSLAMGLAGDRVPAREGVLEIAARREAIAAVNAGFFALADGRPIAMLKSRGTLLGRTSRPRGAVAITTRRGAVRLLFDRVSVTLASAARARPDVTYRTRLGTSAKDWARAPDAVSGAGLLLLDGRVLDDWHEEGLTSAFDTTRHPRTMVGVDGDAAIWLVTIDGRNPSLSLGMTFAELQSLARRLGLRSALNLDGGGSTTMVAGGRIVNHPSDATGPRPVSDALLVLARQP
jgi:phosphodiester glycosidase